MTKADLMESFDDVLTDRRLDAGIVERGLAATTAEPVLLLGQYLALASGGSTGRRGVFVANVEETAAIVSSVLRPMAARSASQPLPPSGMTIGLVAAPSAVHATGCAPAILAGSPFNMVPIPSTLPLPEIVHRLNALQPMVLFGYASMLALLAREQVAGRLAISPVGLTSTSETLTAETRSVLEQVFSVPLVDTFGSTEGLYGSTAPGDTAFVMSSDICIVELVDDHNRPVPPGTPSSKILLTNLVNHTQPLIRYVITDRFVRMPDSPDHGHLRATVEGRGDEVFHYPGVDIHPIVVRSMLVKAPSVLDYQVRQVAGGVHVSIVSGSSPDIAGIQEQLVASLETAGLTNPEVRVDVVPALRRHQDSGKLARFVPLHA